MDSAVCAEINLPGFDRMLSVAFTGHRAASLPWRYNESDERCLRVKARLREAIGSAYASGKRFFLSGMASGTDVYAAEAVLGLKSVYPGIRLICVFPCPAADRRAAEIASRADCTVLLSNEYTAGCLQLRNRFLVDNSSLLIAVYDGRLSGGTLSTLRLAELKGLRTVLIGCERR